MALRIWLPLNGNTDNLGLANFLPTTTNVTYTDLGKIGLSCYANGTISMTAAQTQSIFNNDSLTIAFWIKPTDAEIPHIIFGNDTNRQFSLFQYSGNTASYPHGLALHWDWRWEWESGINYNVNGTTSSTTATWLGNVFSENEWSHVCVTYQRPVMKIYINGVLKAMRTRKLSTDDFSSFSYTTNLLTGQSSSSSRNLNDLRVYDHCLSVNEVQTLSQGLVAHYKLEGLKLTNLVPQDSNFESGSWGGIATTNSQSYMGEKSLYLKRGTTVAHESNFPKPIIGHKYYGREMIKTNGDIAAADCRFEIFGGDGPGKNWVFGVNRGNYPDWTINSSIISIDSVVLDSYGIRTFVVDSSNDVFIDSMIVVDLTADFGAGNEPSKEWCDVNIPYFTGTLEFTNTTDSSGYNNDGVASAPFTFSPDTKRYKTSTIFKDNKYINCGRGAMVTDALTVSCWAYCDNWSSVGRIISCTQNGGWDFWPNGNGQMTMEVYRNNGYITGLSPTNLATWSSGWHHIVGTYDGYKAEIYVDGVKGTSSATTTTKYPIKYNNTNSIFIGAEPSDNPDTPEGVYFTGKLSDVRIYATAFTEQDVQRLYNTPISLSNDGTLNALEYIETSLSKFTKTGLVVADIVRDCDATGNTQATQLQIFKNATQSTDFIEW